MQWLHEKAYVEQLTIDQRASVICPQKISYKQLYHQCADQIHNCK
jgi:hypothetical protein